MMVESVHFVSGSNDQVVTVSLNNEYGRLSVLYSNTIGVNSPFEYWQVRIPVYPGDSIGITNSTSGRVSYTFFGTQFPLYHSSPALSGAILAAGG